MCKTDIQFLCLYSIKLTAIVSISLAVSTRVMTQSISVTSYLRSCAVHSPNKCNTTVTHASPAPPPPPAPGSKYFSFCSDLSVCLFQRGERSKKTETVGDKRGGGEGGSQSSVLQQLNN